MEVGSDLESAGARLSSRGILSLSYASSFNGQLLLAIGTTAEIFYGSMAALGFLRGEFGSEPVEGRRSGLLEDGEDDGNVDGNERLRRFRLTSTAKRAASVTAVARSMTATANPQVSQMPGGMAGK